MNDVSSFRAVALPVALNVGSSADAADLAVFSPDDVFDLIERTAEAMRSLQQDNEMVVAREQACRMQLELDRAAWRSDLQALKRTVEDCLARAVAAERQTAEARAQARLAMQICREVHGRETAAVDRADKADARARLLQDQLARFREKLSSEFNAFLVRHVP